MSISRRKKTQKNAEQTQTENPIERKLLLLGAVNLEELSVIVTVFFFLRGGPSVTSDNHKNSECKSTTHEKEDVIDLVGTE